jgi:DNA repair exonuclease SbcCD ATPase subunit
MPHFKTLEYKNIQSIGNHPMKIDLVRSPHTLLGGHNGSGKSTMLYALAYGLYGKFISGATLAESINSVNKKNLLVKVGFTERGDDYLVIRGEKPKKFEIYKNNELQNQDANARDYQKILDLIIGMDYKTFTQIVLLNKEKYVPFMEMGAAARRKIVEDILGISIFSEMNEVTKAKIKENQRTTSNIERQIEIKQTELTGQQQLVTQIQDSLASASKDNQSKIDECRSEITKLEKRTDLLNSKLCLLSTEGHEKIQKQKREYEKLAIEFEHKIDVAKKDSKFFENNEHCPTCGQSINEELKQQKQHECDEKVSEVESIIGQMMGELEQVVQKNDEFNKIREQVDTINNEISQDNYQIQMQQKQINTLLKQSHTSNDTKQLDDAVELYEGIESVITSLKDDHQQAYDHGQLLEVVRGVLKDDGVKAVIVREYLSIINKKINEYLQSMNFFINMTLDENFKESFAAMHKEKFTMNNLSTGQKSRVNIAIWLALLEVASIKNSVVSNVLLLDEIMENLDAEGVKDVMILFKEKLSDKNIFVITQRFDEFEDLFRSSIRFKLNQGFTEMI